MYLSGDPLRKSQLRLYDVLVFIIITIVVVNIIFLLYSYLITKGKKGMYGNRGIQGSPGKKGEDGICNSDCGKKVCIGIVLEENNKYLNKLLYEIVDEYIPFSNYVDKKIEVVSYGMTTDDNVVIRKKIHIPGKYNDRALAIFTNDNLYIKDGDIIHYINYGKHDSNDVNFPKTNIGSIKVKDNFFVKILKTNGEEVVLKPGEYDRMELDDKNLDKTDTIEKITIETEIQNKFLINKINRICHSDNYQKTLERPGERKINEQKLIRYVTDITKKWMRELFYFKIDLSKDGKKDTVYAGLRFILEPNFKIDMLKNYKDSSGKIINNPFYTYKPSPEDDTTFLESKGEIIKYDIWNWSEQYYSNKPIIKKCFKKNNLPNDEQPPLSIVTTNDYIPIYTSETAQDLYNTANCPYGQLNDKMGFPTNPKGKTHCVYLDPSVNFELDENNNSIRHSKYSKKITRAWKDKKVYNPDNHISLYHPKSFIDKHGRKYFPLGSVWTGTKDINKPKFSDHTPPSDSSCSSHGKFGPKKETVLVSGDVKPPLRYNQLWSSEDIDSELVADVSVKGAVFFEKKDQSGTSHEVPNNNYTKLKFRNFVPNAESVVVKPNNIVRIDYIEDDGTTGFDEFVSGGHNFDNYRQYNKIDYKFQFIPITAKTSDKSFPPIHNGGEYYITSLNYINQEFYFLKDIGGKGEFSVIKPHTPLELYDHANFGGTRVDLGVGPSYVGAVSERASSFKIAKGYYVKFCDWKGGGHPNESCRSFWHPSRSTEIRWAYGPRDETWIRNIGLGNDNLDWVSVKKIPDLYFYGKVKDYIDMKMTIIYEDGIYFSIKSGNGRYLNLKDGFNFTTEKDTLEFYEHSVGSILIRSIKYNKILYFDSDGKSEVKPFSPYIDLTSKVVLDKVKLQYMYFFNNENKYLQDDGGSRDIIFAETEINPYQRHTVQYYKNNAFTIKGKKSFAYLTATENDDVKFINKTVSDSVLFMFENDTSIPYSTAGVPITETEVYIKSFKYDKYLGIDSSGKLKLDQINKLNAITFKVLIEEVDDSLQNSIYSHIKIWRPIEPPGYKCLGDVVTSLNEEPSINPENPSIVCVPEDCVESVPIINQCYNNKSLKVEMNGMNSDGKISIGKIRRQKAMELWSTGATGSYEENRYREEQDYADDGGHNLFRFSENGKPDTKLSLKINRSCLKNRVMKNVEPKSSSNVLNMIDNERDDYKKSDKYFDSYPLDAYIENRRVDDENKIITENKSYYLQYATDKPLSTKQIENNNQTIDGSIKERGDGIYFVKASGKDRNQFDNCLVVENNKIKRSDICNFSNKNHLWELMDFNKFNEEQTNIDGKFSHNDKTEIELRHLGSENKCLKQTYDEQGIINESLVTCKTPTVQDDKNRFTWMYRTIDSNDSIDSFEDAAAN